MKKLAILICILFLSFSIMGCFEDSGGSSSEEQTTEQEETEDEEYVEEEPEIEEPEEPEVVVSKILFANDSYDLIILNGIKFGKAEHYGALYPGDYTGFYEIDPGSYYVYLLDRYANWIVATAGKFYIEKETYYALVLEGTLDNFWYVLYYYVDE